MSGVRSHPTVWIGVHDLERTGVPVVLVRYLRGLDPEARRHVYVVARRGGALRSEMAAVAAGVTVLSPTGRRGLGDAGAVGLEVLGARRSAHAVRAVDHRIRTRHLPHPDVVVIHGAGAAGLLDSVGADVPVVLHLHELATGIDRSIPHADLPAVIGRARTVMAVSRPVAELAASLGAGSAAVQIVPGVTDEPVGSPHHDPVDTSTWVMGCGRPGWRKGTDRLATIAHALADQPQEVRVAWVGGRPGGADAMTVTAPDPVHWIDECAQPWDHLSRARVLVVPSREDPLPLVALEAGRRSIPVVSFDSGGLTDLLAGGRGVVVDRHDVLAMADAVAELLVDDERREAVGQLLRSHVVQRYTAAVVVPDWWRIITDSAS